MGKTSWEADKLGRREECIFLSQYLRSKFDQDHQSGAFVLNVSAGRGLGKSYFLRNWAQDVAAEGHPVVQLNAWDTDFSMDPLLSLLSEFHFKLTTALVKAPKAQRLLRDAIDQGKNLIKPSQPVVTSLLNNTLTGLSRDQLNELMALEDEISKEGGQSDERRYQDVLSGIMPAAAEHALHSHKLMQQSILTFKEKLGLFLQHVDKEMQSLSLPLFVFIDELDHCRPKYIVELLEKVRQLFSLRGVVFVVAAESELLSHAIRSVYGRNADTSRFLQQFFDQQYNLIEPKKYQYVEYLFQKHRLENETRFFTPLNIKFSVTRNVHMDLFAIMSKYFRLSMHDQDQVCSMLQTVCLTWQLDQKIHLVYILFLLMLQQRNDEVLSRYLRGAKLAQRMAVLDESTFSNLIDPAVIVRTNMETGDRFYTPEKKEPFDQVLRKYVEFANLSMPEIKMSNGAGLEVYTVVQEQLTLDMPEQYNPESPPRHELWRYHDLVKKVSHLLRR